MYLFCVFKRLCYVFRRIIININQQLMRMKTLPALIIAFGLSIATYAQQLPGKPADILPKTFNPLNLQRQYDGKLLMEQAAKHRQVLSSHPVARPKPTGLKRADGQSVDTVAYLPQPRHT